MISNNQQGFKKTANLQMTEFVRLKRKTNLQTKNRIIPKKPPPKKLPLSPKIHKMQTQYKAKQNNLPQIKIPRLDIPSQLSGSILSGLQIGQIELSTNVIPLVRIPPRYPMRAANRHIEGWVKVEFTITKQGTVKDAVVVAAQPNKIFNKSALQAIRLWKFKAKIIAGEAFEQRVVQVLQFKLKK